MPFFLHRAVDGQTQLLRVQGTLLRIGRGTGADLAFPDAAVALEHAEIRQEREGFLLADRGSVTGTLLNDAPIQTARLRNDDRITIGPYVIRVQITDPSDPLFLHVSPLPALEATKVTEPAAPVRRERRREPRAARADYGRAYALKRPYFSKALLSLALIALAGLWVLALRDQVLAGGTPRLRPGPLSAAHATVPKLAECAQCHTPWRQIANQSCEGCHEGPVHQPQQIREPGCGECHPEHRDRVVLTAMPDRSCVDCHGRLELLDGSAPRVARKLRTFDDHPEFRPEEDPSALRLDHALHLAPNLLAGDGSRVQLACGDCHRPDLGEIAPVVFEQHCRRCHDLRFDDRLPELEAPHGEVDGMLRAVFGTYVKDRDALAALSPGELRRLVFERGGPGLSFDERTRRLARRVAREMLRSRCAKCHQMTTTAELEAEVVPPQVPAVWLTAARFSHAPHLRIAEVGCETCHERALTSRETRDVLLPGRETCLPCHGEEGGATAAAGWSPTRCVTCHYYHERSPGWVPVTVAQASGLSPAGAPPRSRP